MSTITSALAVAAALLLAPALPEPPATEPSNDDPMRGPVVRDKAVRTLVQRDMSGKLIRVEGRPEAAAIMQLSLDSDQREKAREIVAERAANVRSLLVEQIDVVKEATDAILSGNRGAAEKLARELYDQFEQPRRRDPLLEPLSVLLSPSDAAEMKRIIDEYWEAWIASETRGKQTREEVEKRLAFAMFQEEVRTAYEGTLRPYKDRLDRIERITEPTPEQKAEIREAMIGYIREGKLKPTAEQRAALARRIYQALDEDRRIKLFEAALFQ